LEPQGLGALQLAFEQLKARLAAEGLFDEARKRPLPFFPCRVGVATALGGAALHDILAILRQRCPRLHVVVRPVRVQGIGAAGDIVDAIEDLNAYPGLEVLIVGRGGGSLEDLWSFNEERVARAIAASRLPIVSAVGHEIDLTIADLVADRRAPTPTAAAEMIVPRTRDLTDAVSRAAAGLAGALARRTLRERRVLDDLGGRLRDPRRRLADVRAQVTLCGRRAEQAVRQRAVAARAALGGVAHRLRLQDPRIRVATCTERVAGAQHRLALASAHAVAAARERVVRAAGALDGLSPLGVLQRGYSLTRTLPERAIVRDAQTLAPGDRVEITFAVGRALARVERGGGGSES
jgi:exodeoxyribonuclease VII large subunit